MFRNKFLVSVLLLSASAFFLGCGDKPIKTEFIGGIVTYNGEPLPDASITFLPVDKSSGAQGAVGTTDAKGEFKIQTLLGAADAGTTPGDYIVVISKTELVKTGRTTTEADGTKTEETIPKPVIPQRYSDSSSSGLTATVKANEKNHFEFKLTD